VEEGAEGDSDDMEFTSKINQRFHGVNGLEKQAESSEDRDSSKNKTERTGSMAGQGGKVTKNKKGTKLVDDAVDEQRRRSSRVNSDANTMDKAVDLAKKKNLETISGIPTVINSSSCTLNGIATSIGVRLGQNAIEAEGIINAMKELEEARFNLFLASKRGPDKLGVEDTCKIDSFDPEGISTHNIA
jgi:hypothetical protein